MKKWFSVLCISLMTCVSVFATTYNGPTNLSNQTLKDVVIHGPAQLTQVKADSLSVMGPLQFSDLQVSQDATVIGAVNNSQKGKFTALKITGPFNAKNIITDSLQVIGPVNVNGIIVSGDTVILGPLNAQNSRFNNITVTAERVNLVNVEVNNIYVKKTGTDVKPTVILSGKTNVVGSIQFESKNGVVSIKGKSTVKGQVEGGETLEPKK